MNMKIIDKRVIQLKDIRKGPILYKGMVRGRRKFLIINLIVTAIYILYLIRSAPFIAGKFHGPHELDVQNFLASTEDITISEVIEMKKRADKSIPTYAFFSTSYSDGDKYRFNVSFDSVEETGIEYTTEFENPETGEMETFVMYSVFMGRIGERVIPILSYGNVASDTALTGIFVEPAPVITADISKLTADGNALTINKYIFDARNLEMETENSDVVVMFAGIALLAFLYIRLLRYYINPYKHPTYKQLAKYGNLEDVINDIENQFEEENVYKEGKELISTDWIMTKDTFKNKILKNHRTRGRYS